MGMSGQLEKNINVTLDDGNQLSAFGGLRVANPYSIFDHTFRYNIESTLFDTSTATSGTVTHLPNSSSVRLTAITTSGSSAIIQTRSYMPYQPGKGFVFSLSANIGTAKTNVRKRLGYFDANDGLFLEQTGSGLSLVLRTSTSGAPVDTAVAQSSWNIDKLDGTGISGITLNPATYQLFFCDFQWQGTGRIRFGFNLGGQIVYVHQILNANSGTLPYMKTATLPFRFEITNTGTAASNTTMDITCMTAFSEGGYNPNGILRYASNGTTTKTVPGTATLVPVLSIRKASSAANAVIKLAELQVFSTTADDLEWVLLYNTTLTGASWVALTGIAEKDVTATAVSGGVELTGGYLRASAGGASVVVSEAVLEAFNSVIGNSISGTSDIFTIAVRNISSASSMLAAITYKEII